MAEDRLTRDMYFEPDGEDYLYYELPGYPGVRVTAVERERFLSGNEEGWIELIASRGPSVPPRANNFARFQKRMWSLRPFMLTSGVAAVSWVVHERDPRIKMGAGLLALIFLGAGIVGLLAPTPEKPYGH